MTISDEQAKRLGDQLAGLERAALALDRDVRKLGRWLFPQETFDREAPSVSLRPLADVDELIRRVQEHRRNIIDTEGRIGKMEALLRETLENVVSREEMRRHFKAHPPRQRGKDDA